MSITLQRKKILQDAVNTDKRFFVQMRSDQEFQRFYIGCVDMAKKFDIGEPRLPRQRKRPARYEDGSLPHIHSSVQDHYRSVYYEALDLLSGELERRFENQHVLVVLSIEKPC